jgi:hypothetical protein
MNTLAAQLQSLATVLSSADDVVRKFQALRDFCTDEQWEEFSTAGPLGDLLDSLSDLECDLERA